MEKLKSCPFCGVKAEFKCEPIRIKGTWCDAVYVHCKGCGARTNHVLYDAKLHSNGSEYQQVAAAWNRRAAQGNKACTNCSGIVYRQTNSGKIIPVDQRCGAKITPPCYRPDGDGCAYQIYGDNNDEPIDRCKACPLCYSDKVRHTVPENKALTCEGCRHSGQWEDEYEYGYPSPCTGCNRRCPDNYEARKPGKEKWSYEDILKQEG